MFASLTLVPMLSGCFQPGRGTADAQGGDHSDRNWFCQRASAAFRRLQAKDFAGNGRLAGPRRVKRRLALLSIPVVPWLLVSLHPPADSSAEGNRNFIWLTEPSQEPVFQKQ